ncbi:MAG: DinB family protein [Bacteroidota bacterium]
MAADILAELATTRTGLLESLAPFNQEQFNTVPFEGSWTPGQVAEHVYKSIQGVPHLLNGEALTPDRDPALNVANLRHMFLDFSTKMKSPDFILPSDEPKDRAALVQSLADSLAAIIQSAQTKDLDLIIKDFEFPGSGPVTRLELLNFISVHTQRHAHQLRKMQQYF